MGMCEGTRPQLHHSALRRLVQVAVAAVLLMQLITAFNAVHLGFWTGERFYYHDNLVMFVNMHLGYQSWLHGQMPLWSPEINGGEPLWPLVESVPTADPIALICWTTCYQLRRPSLMAFEWTTILWLTAFSVGGAVCARQVSRSNWVAFAVFVLLLCGPLGLAAIAQCAGLIAPFRYLPWTILAFIHFQRRPAVGRACLWGLSNAFGLAGYQTGYAVLFEGLFIAAYLAGGPRVWRAPVGRLVRLYGVALLTAVVAGLPTLVTAVKLSQLVPIARISTTDVWYNYPVDRFVGFLIFPYNQISRWHGSPDISLAGLAAAFFALAWFIGGPFLSRLAPKGKDLAAARFRALGRFTDLERAWLIAGTGAAILGLDHQYAIVKSDGQTFLGLRNYGFLLTPMVLSLSMLFAAGARRLQWLQYRQWVLVTFALVVALPFFILPAVWSSIPACGVLLVGLILTAYRGPQPGRSGGALLWPLLAVLVCHHMTGHGAAAVPSDRNVSELVRRMPTFDPPSQELVQHRQWLFTVLDRAPYHYQGPALHHIPSALMEGPRVDQFQPTPGGTPFTPITHQLRVPRYHQLITRGLPPETLRAVLGVDRPVFRVATDAVWVPSPGEALAELRIRPETVRQEDTVLLEGPTQANPRTSTTAEISLRVSTCGPETLSAEVSLPTPGYAVFLDNNDADWRGYVDGQRAEVLPADFIGKALAVPKGEHTIRFEYRPWAYLIAFWIRFTVWAAVAVWSLGWLVSRLLLRARS